MLRWIFLLFILCSACGTAPSVVGTVNDLEGANVIQRRPAEGCTADDGYPTILLGAKLDADGLYIQTRTTTMCDQHTFAIYTCEMTPGETTYRVRQTNSCGEMTNDGVVEHVLFIKRDDLPHGTSTVTRIEKQNVSVAH